MPKDYTEITSETVLLSEPNILTDEQRDQIDNTSAELQVIAYSKKKTTPRTIY
jgi:hypothetical protein